MASFRERLDRDEFPITYEAISPRTGVVAAQVEAFAQLPCLSHLAAVNLTNNPSARVRIDPAAYGHLLQEACGVEVVAHITCRDDTLAGIQRWLLGAWALGIRNVSVMTGDHPKEGDYPEERRVDSVNALELIAGVRRYLAKGELMPDVMMPTATRYANRFAPPKPVRKTDPMDFLVGAPIIPWRNNEDAYARAKLESGAQFFQTQITWDAKPVLDWVERLEQTGVLGARGRYPVPVLVGASPLRALRTMEFMHASIPFVKVPEPVQQRLKAAKDIGPESVAVALEMYADLIDGAKSRGLTTKLGAHVLPINDDALGNAIVEGVAKL
ncbi:MAG: methylenetetrahydrofolate reductase [Thermoplasmata archaeon]|jgi:5,10-methylenetetrahydrofolate reductase|nr:methylenetetrahydrofolate reductase [Thermoplasmata archaeon]